MTESDAQQWYYLLNDQQVGPIGQLEMLALIANQTVTPATVVWRAGMSGWEQASKTDLAQYFAPGTVPTSVGTPTSGPPPISPAWDQAGKVPIWNAIGEAFRLVFKHPMTFILGNLIMMMINAMGFGLLGGVWLSGMMHAARKARSGQPVVISDIFQGFERFGPVLGANLIGNLAASVGFMFCILPGYIIGSQFMYLVPLVAFKGLSIGEGITLSRQKAKNRAMNHFVFFLLISLISLSGIILCGVGILVTAPVFPLAIAIAYGVNFENQNPA